METDKVIQDLNHRFAAPFTEFYESRIISSGTMKTVSLMASWKEFS